MSFTATPDVDTTSPSIGKRYKQIFRRIVGAEMLEKSRMAKVLQVGKSAMRFSKMNGIFN